MLHLLDTDVVSNLRKQTPNAQLIAWLKETPQEDFAIPLVVVFEIQRGVETLRLEGKAELADQIEAWLNQMLDAAGVDGVLCPGVDVVRLQAGMFADPALRNFLLPNPGSPKPKFGGDIIIAAMAIVYQAAIVSFNVDDYLQIHQRYPLPGLFHPGRREWVLKPAEAADMVR